MSRATNNIGWAGAIAVAGFAFGMVPEASAETLLQIDLNSVVATVAVPGFGVSYTGTITLSSDLDAVLAGIEINGVNQTIGAGFVLTSLTGTITTSSGGVTGGSFTIDVFDGTRTDTYTAMITSGFAGSIVRSTAPVVSPPYRMRSHVSPPSVVR